MNRATPCCLALTFLLGCGETDDSEKDPNDTSDTQADTDTDTDTDANDEKPVVRSAEALYFHHTVGTDAWGWSFAAVADDPQGTATIEAWLHEQQAVFVLDPSGTTKASYDLTCQSGECNGTCWEADDNILHTETDKWTFRFIVVDEDGNASDPLDVKGAPDPVSGT